MPRRRVCTLLLHVQDHRSRRTNLCPSHESRLEITMRLSPVIPAPKEAEYSDQTVALDSTWGVADRSQLDGLADSVASKFGIGREPRAKSFSLNRDPKLADEEYRLDISQSAVAISAASRRGFLHALATLTQLRDGPILPVAKVRDYPRLPTRGLQIMLESYHQIGREAQAQHHPPRVRRPLPVPAARPGPLSFGADPGRAAADPRAVRIAWPQGHPASSVPRPPSLYAQAR